MRDGVGNVTEPGVDHLAYHVAFAVIPLPAVKPLLVIYVVPTYCVSEPLLLDSALYYPPKVLDAFALVGDTVPLFALYVTVKTFSGAVMPLALVVIDLLRALSL